MTNTEYKTAVEQLKKYSYHYYSRYLTLIYHTTHTKVLLIYKIDDTLTA